MLDHNRLHYDIRCFAFVSGTKLHVGLIVQQIRKHLVFKLQAPRNFKSLDDVLCNPIRWSPANSFSLTSALSDIKGSHLSVEPQSLKTCS